MLISQKAKEAARNPNQNLPFLSSCSMCYSHTFCQSVLKKEGSLSQKEPGQNEAWVPCSPQTAWLRLPRSFSRAARDRHSSLATCAKIPGFAPYLDLLWKLAINTTLEEAVLQGDVEDVQQLWAPQYDSQGRTSQVQRAPYCSAHTENWVRFKEWDARMIVQVLSLG